MAFWVLRRVRRIRGIHTARPSRIMSILLERLVDTAFYTLWLLQSAKRLIRRKNSDAKFFAKGLRHSDFEVQDLQAQLEV
jgi:hypothetical protein